MAHKIFGSTIFDFDRIGKRPEFPLPSETSYVREEEYFIRNCDYCNKNIGITRTAFVFFLATINFPLRNLLTQKKIEYYLRLCGKEWKSPALRNPWGYYWKNHDCGAKIFISWNEISELARHIYLGIRPVTIRRLRKIYQKEKELQKAIVIPPGRKMQWLMLWYAGFTHKQVAELYRTSRIWVHHQISEKRKELGIPVERYNNLNPGKTIPVPLEILSALPNSKLLPLIKTGEKLAKMPQNQ